MEQEVVLDVAQLNVDFVTRKGRLHILDDVHFSLRRGETLGIVGESGCGKSVTSLSVMRLLPENGEILEGSRIEFEGKDLTRLSDKELCRIRGRDIAMIFQDPMTSLDPVKTIGSQLAEAAEIHTHMTRKEARKRSLDMLERVGVSAPEERLSQYSFQLSGGTQQRVGIAMALMCSPKVLIADEPTTALDVTVQAQILALMKEIQQDMDMSIILISHDMGVISHMADRILVMYAGQVAEEGTRDAILHHPLHPYTQGLLRSIPDMTASEQVLYSIPGVVPGPLQMPAGCRFHPRCPFAAACCAKQKPELISLQGERVRCLLYDPRTKNEFRKEADA